MKEVKFLAIKYNDTEMTILCQDGGIVFIEMADDSLVSYYHTFRLPKKSDCTILSEMIKGNSKVNVSTWSCKRDEIGLDMITDAVESLYCSTDVILPVITFYDRASTDDNIMFVWLENNYISE
jgi:hypothetical protein